MKELVFLLEEESAKAPLESLLPRLLSPQVVARFIPFEGRQDLEAQLMKRLRGYLNPDARFIILRDQDSAPDCKVIKARLLDLCRLAGKDALSLVRIACRELEAFHLADLKAVGFALGVPGLEKHQNKAKFRAPERLGSAARELKALTGNACEKVGGSRQIGAHLDLQNARCRGFQKPHCWNQTHGAAAAGVALTSLPVIDGLPGRLRDDAAPAITWSYGDLPRESLI